METMKTIARRHSVREYKDVQIPEEALDLILAAGNAAAMGMKAYDRLHMAVVQDKALHQRLNESILQIMGDKMGKRDHTFGASTLVVISAKDPENCPMKGMHYINSGCVAQNMMLAATELGLGSVVNGIVSVGIGTNKELQKNMGIPEEYTPLFAVVLGYPMHDEVIEKEMTHKITVSRR